MLDVAVAYNRYRFIGNEFLTWLWFMIDSHPHDLNAVDADMTSLAVGNRIVLENTINDAREIITIKGDDAGLEEGLVSLRKGATVVELNLVYKALNQEWQFTLKGENLSFYGLKVPQTGPIETAEDIEGMILEKAYLYEKAVMLVDHLFNFFLKRRCSAQWQQTSVAEIKKWIHR
jgi:hypothetical protein